MDVADDVKRPVIGSAVGPQRRAPDLRGVDLLDRSQHVHAVEPLAPQTLQGFVQLGALLAHDVRAEAAVLPRAVALLADRLRHVEHDRDREQIVFPGELDERASRLALHVGRVHHREPRLRQTTAGDEVQDRERVHGRALVVLIVGDQAATEVRGDHLRRREVPARERALARARRLRSAPRGWDPEDRSSSA